MTASVETRRLPARVSWVAEANNLRRIRGTWMLLTTKPNKNAAWTTSWQINRGVLWAFQPCGDFEARVMGTGVWVRYLGDGA